MKKEREKNKRSIYFPTLDNRKYFIDLLVEMLINGKNNGEEDKLLEKCKQSPANNERYQNVNQNKCRVLSFKRSPKENKKPSNVGKR